MKLKLNKSFAQFLFDIFFFFEINLVLPLVFKVINVKFFKFAFEKFKT